MTTDTPKRDRLNTKDIRMLKVFKKLRIPKTCYSSVLSIATLLVFNFSSNTAKIITTEKSVEKSLIFDKNGVVLVVDVV